MTIVATGMSVYNSVQAAMELEKQGFDVGVIDLHTIKPVDSETIIAAARETGAVLTVEDHNTQGGMGSIVADVLMQAGVVTKFKKIGIPDEFVEYGYPEALYPHYGMDIAGIVKTSLELISR